MAASGSGAESKTETRDHSKETDVIGRGTFEIVVPVGCDAVAMKQDFPFVLKSSTCESISDTDLARVLGRFCTEDEIKTRRYRVWGCNIVPLMKRDTVSGLEWQVPAMLYNHNDDVMLTLAQKGRKSLIRSVFRYEARSPDESRLPERDGTEQVFTKTYLQEAMKDKVKSKHLAALCLKSMLFPMNRHFDTSGEEKESKYPVLQALISSPCLPRHYSLIVNVPIHCSIREMAEEKWDWDESDPIRQQPIYCKETGILLLMETQRVLTVPGREPMTSFTNRTNGWKSFVLFLPTHI